MHCTAIQLSNIYWIDFHNLNILEVCTVQLYCIGQYSVSAYSILNDSDQGKKT